MLNIIDFDESEIYHQNPKILELLLKDQNTGGNICWATENYIDHGHMPQDEILLTDITEHNIIRPRVLKEKNIQRKRTRERAEVFTPSNIVEQQVSSVFNQKKDDIQWMMESVWIEITCGEAPYIVSRYDTTTGVIIPCSHRVGFLDRKFQLLNEIISDKQEWLEYAKQLYKKSYGYEFQGDSLLIARENLFLTVIDYYQDKFGLKSLPTDQSFKRNLEEIAEIISYNLIQADGLTGNIPFSDYKKIPKHIQLSLFDNYEEVVTAKKAQFIDWNKHKKIKVNNFGEEKMKFDVIIGNPPYQKNDGGGTGDSATPLYPLFISIAKKLNPEYISFIIPSRWMQGGKSLTKFRADMIADTHIRKMVDFFDSKECFPNVNLDGGVCYFIRDAQYEGPTEYVYKPKNEEAIVSTRYLKNDVTDDVIRDYRRMSIIEKTRKNKFETFSNIVSSRKPYGIEGIFNNPDKYKNLHLTFTKRDNSLKIWGVKGKKGGAKRIFGYVDADGVEQNLESIDKYKLFFSKAYSTGATVPPEIIVGEPGVICTETFLEIGPFDSSIENSDCLKYIKTKFFRALLFFKRINLNNSKGVFELIPLQDFTENSDIDWTKSIHEIDQQLYEKYELSADEIQYIEENVKEME